MSDANTLYSVKRWSKNVIHIYDFIYGVNFYWIFAPNHAEYCKIMKRVFNLDFEPCKIDGRFQIIDKRGIECGVIWAKPHEVDAIAHECLHATAWLMRKRGLPLTSDTEEAYCYFLDFLVETITKAKK